MPDLKENTLFGNFTCIIGLLPHSFMQKNCLNIQLISSNGDDYTVYASAVIIAMLNTRE